MANKRGPSFKDVEIEFFCNGMTGVRQMAQDNNISRAVLEKAAASLGERGQDVSEINALITELHGEKGTGKGRTPPSVGDVRNYKGQQVKDGGVFGRIPLDTLGTEKGGLCNVAFLEDEQGPYLVVRPGAASTGEQTPDAVEVDLDDDSDEQF